MPGEGVVRPESGGDRPFEFVERKVGSHVLYKRVENHWRQTPAYKELEFRWVPEDVTRLATLLSGEVHISDVPRALQADAVAKGMKVLTSTQTAICHEWLFGGMYFATPDKLDAKVPYTDKRVRQAMNMAINRKAIADSILGGKAEPALIQRYHPQVDAVLWPGFWDPSWERRFEDMYGYNPTKAKKLLEEAGYKNGFEFTVYLYTLPGMPELGDIGQALALDWEAVGLKPKLVEIDFPRVREQYRTKTIHGAVWPLRGSPNALNTLRIFNKAKELGGVCLRAPVYRGAAGSVGYGGRTERTCPADTRSASTSSLSSPICPCSGCAAEGEPEVHRGLYFRAALPGSLRIWSMLLAP